MSAHELITDHLDLWTGAVTQKRSGGRGNNGKIELTGIKKLRELILELAVRGKLVEQDPNDEPASMLLERIAEEKARLVKEGKIKKPKKLPEAALNDLPAPLPRGWVAVTLSHLGVFGGGKTPSKSKDEFWNGDIPWVTPKDMKFAEITDTEDHVTDAATASGGLELLPQSAVLFVVRSGILRRIFPTAITRTQCTINQDLKALQLFKPNMARYIQIMSWGFEGFILTNLTKTGTTVESLKFSDFASQAFPLPPLDEQHRIVEKVDELMALCDRLEQQVGDQLEAHEVLVDTLLDALTRSADAAKVGENWARIAEHFDTLFTTEASIDKLKQAILQLAVMGRLVEQDPNDEPACVLLERIAEEKARLVKEGKIKRTKKLSDVSEDEMPFDLPTGWAWTHFESIVDPKFTISYGVLVPGPDTENGVPFVRVADLSVRNPSEYPEKTISHEVDKKFSKTRLHGGEILLCVVGSIGKLGIAPSSWKGANIARAICRIMPTKLVSKNYILMLLQTEFMQDRFGKDTRTLAQPTLNIGLIRSATTPLPPYDEQQRIIEKVDELIALCDQLKARLGEAGETRTHLAEAVVEQAVS
ncbi:restriction endonuclease subunit S [uncultured Halomonas sp.]|uniref:restriction endonuclease subunit S n=1 Tax=uncultured Halomonas sp. TaxID=173971 RepID=UPI002613F2A8|nr:restriction endonuclease subunit S [uncultured Halomonas sp.]